MLHKSHVDSDKFFASIWKNSLDAVEKGEFVKRVHMLNIRMEKIRDVK